jgi:hypothetical protein
VDTLSKIGLVLVAAGLSWIAGPGADWPGWVIAAVGVTLAFGRDLFGAAAKKRDRHRELAERVPRWEAGIIHAEDVSKLLLTLTPPPSEPVDSTINCEVELPDDFRVAEAREVPLPPYRDDKSFVVPPGSVKSNGKWNEYYLVLFPDNFRAGLSALGRLSPGEYVVTWSRDHGFGRQTLRRCTFKIDRHGTLSP